MRAVPVRGFAEQHVGRRHRSGIAQDGSVGTTEVPREHEPAVGAVTDLQLDRRGAEYVPRTAIARPDARRDREGGVIRTAGEERQDGMGIGDGVERQGRTVLRVAPPVGALGLLFLQMRGIGKQDLRERCRRAGTVDRPGEPVPHQQRQATGVIDVGMGQDDGVERPGIEGKRAPVAQPQLLQPLEQPAVEQYSATAGPHQVRRPGDGPGGTEELHGGTRHDRKLAATGAPGVGSRPRWRATAPDPVYRPSGR